MRLPFRPAAAITAAVLIVACAPGDGVPADTESRADSPAATSSQSAASSRSDSTSRSSPPRASPAPSAATPARPLGSAAPASAHPGAPAGIAWFAGDLDSAFDAADASNEPVLLYWGAEWCPYCADLEAHVFSREDVKQKLEFFVPIYLDGDDPGAQRAADAFGVAGYPTVLALAPDRTELARIAGGMDLTQYAEMLDLVLGDLRPIDDILRAREAGPLSPDDCKRLAYNGWPLADAAAERAAHLAATLADAAERCTDAGTIDRARLIVFATSFAVADDSNEAQPLARGLVREMRRIVADRELAVSIADALRELDERYFAAVQAQQPEAVPEFLDHWAAVMDAASVDPRYGYGDQLGAVRSKVEAVAALAPSGVPEPMADDARRRVDEALAAVGRSPARAGAANAAINLLVAIGDLDRARRIAEEGLEISPTPYYHMADLAWIDEMLGRHDDAIAWLEQAYYASKGPATRFQWGTNYVRGLIRMQPNDDDAIRTAALAVLGELDGPGRIYRRTRDRLETLDAAFREWNATGEHDDVIDALRERMSGICSGISADEPDARGACSAFLADAAERA